MSEELNPYQSPQEVVSGVTPQMSSRPAVDRVALILWPVVLGANLIVPLWLGWDITRDHARWGLCSAVALFFIGGWVLCVLRPRIARKVILGSAALSISQIFPIIQLIAGILAMSISAAMGVIPDLEFGNAPADPPNFLGGFVPTAIVGSILLAIAGLLGLGWDSACRSGGSYLLKAVRNYRQETQVSGRGIVDCGGMRDGD